MSDGTCAYCKAREPHYICGSPQSPHYQQTVASEDRCDFFLLNPGQVSAQNGLLDALRDQHEAAIAKFEAGIQLGLPQDDEMMYHSVLSEQYFGLTSRVSYENCLDSRQFHEAINQMERALQIDRDGGYEYFFSRINRVRLYRLDLAYALASDAIDKRQGRIAAIKFLQEKVGLCAYLPTCPLLNVLLRLGELYVQQNQSEGAKICLRNIIAADPVCYEYADDETGLKQEARRRLSAIS